MDIAIIGDGVAGEVAAYYLWQAGHQVTLYGPDHRWAVASWNSTAVVGSFGMTAGQGALGDLLVEALSEARTFYQSFDHASVLSNFLHYLALEPGQGTQHPGTLEQGAKSTLRFERRFGHLCPAKYRHKASAQAFKEPGLLIDSQSFLRELKRRNHSSPLFTRVQKYITSRKQVAHHHQVFYAPGALRHFIALDQVATRPRQGSYLLWQGKFYAQTFHYDFYLKGVISFRREHGQLLVAAVNNEATTGLGAMDGVRHLYREMQEVSGLALPPLEQAMVRSGLRELAGDRRPRLQELEPGFFALSGLYKNGFALAPFFARELMVRMKKLREV